MIKKTTFLKTILVAAGLLVGASNVWADDYSSVYTRAAVSDWADDDKTDWNASSAVEVNATYGLGANANLTATYVSKSFTIGENNKIKYEVDWSFATATGRTGNWNWIQFGDFLRIAINSSYNMQVSTDAGANWNATALGNYGNATHTKHIELIFNTATKTVESFTFDGTDRTALVSGTFTGKTFNTVSTGFVRGGSVGWTLANYITTITVSQAAQVISMADYTVNYKLGEETVKTVASSSAVGSVITADVAVDGEGTYAGNHYLITAVDAPSMTLVAGDNVLNVPVRAPYTATLNVTRTVGGVAESPVVTNLTETDAKVCAWEYAYPLYAQKDGVYYVADETSSFGESGTFTNGDVINKTVAYTNPDYSVVYFGEPNEVAGTNTTYSNGNTGYITGGVVYSSDQVIRLGQLPAGTYHLITNVTGDANRNVKVGDYTAGTESFPTSLVSIETTGAKDETFTVDGTQLICISGKDQGNGKFNQSATVDYILVKASTQSPAIKTTGTTFSSAYAIDCANLPSGVTAYKVTKMTATQVTAEEVTEAVAPNTGLILVATTAGSFDIPVSASGATVTGNLLKAAVTATPVEADKAYGLSAGVFKKLEAGDVPAGKAYLLASDITSAPELTIDFGGEVTGIRSLTPTLSKGEGVMYDLLGRKVAQPTKGLYIVNGKKVVIK